MKNNAVYPLGSPFKVYIQKSPPLNLTEQQLHRIENIWEKETIRTQGKLFNGRILCVDHFDGESLVGHFVEYKIFLAQARDAAIYQELKLHPLCVSSYTYADQSILWGKRSAHVTEFQNFYELVPAGGIDPSSAIEEEIDVIKQFKIELKEETGIDEKMILNITPSYLIFDSKFHIYEICAKIQLAPSAIHLKAPRDEEYTELLWIEETNLHNFVKQNYLIINPLSLQLLQLFKNKNFKDF